MYESSGHLKHKGRPNSSGWTLRWRTRILDPAPVATLHLPPSEIWNIIQWNCRGLCANFDDFRLLCGNYNPVVCCLQETELTKDDFIIRGFNCIHLTSRDIGGRAYGGVSVLARYAHPLHCKAYSESSLNTTLQAKAVTISTLKGYYYNI